MHSESLTFTLRLIDSYDDLMRACAIRAEAYGYRMPSYRETMARPDHVDASPWTAIFLCEDKDTGKAVGTMRIQSTTRGGTVLEIEKYVTPPPELQQHGRAEVTRLASVRGSDPFVRLALWKAAYLYCIAVQARWMLMGVRKPSLLRAYEQMGARDIFADKHEIPLGYAGNLPHRILALDVGTCDQRWLQDNPKLWHFFFATVHPEISVVPLVHRQPVEKVRLHVVQ